MTSRRVLIASVAVLVASVMIGPFAVAQDARGTRFPQRTVERTVVEGSSINGNATVLSEVVDETVRHDGRTSQRALSEFLTDVNGRRRLVSTIEEHRVEGPDGGHQVTRAYMSFDANGRPSITRREREAVVDRGDGLFVTEIEVTTPSINESAFVATERIDQQERRTGDQLWAKKTTAYADPTDHRWDIAEQRSLTRNVANRTAEELIYRRDSSGRLVESERIVSREWTAGRQECRTDETYVRDINNAGALATRPTRLVEIVRTHLSDDESETTRTRHERAGDRLHVVERVVERSRRDGRGGLVIDQDLQRPIVHERLQTVATVRTRKSQ